MKLKLYFFVLLAAVATSCSTSYKSSQTPDDVYYSPVKAGTGTARTEKKPATRPVMRRGYMDRQIVMSTYDPRWRFFNDDFDAYYDPYRYGYTCGYYYNPYYYPSPVYISGAVFQNPKNTTPRMTNLGSYNYSNMVVVNSKKGATQMIRSTRAYNNSNRDNLIRRIITPTNNNNYNNNNYRPADNNTRTYTPSNNNNNSSGSSGGGNSGSSGTPVSRPPRN